jgi:nucleoid DNA-binding protein
MAPKNTKRKVIKKVAKPAVRKPITVKEALGKAAVIRTISEACCITKKDVATVLDSLMEIIEGHLKKRGPGVFTLPGIAKFRVINKPATKARQGISPFTGEPMTFAAKPARNIVKIRALKKLKDSAK